MKRRWGAAACALFTFVVLPVSPVAAHASVVGSNPIDGSALANSPPIAELRFTEDVLVSASSMRLLQLGSGRQTDLVLTATGGGTTLLAELPKLQRGAYILRYVAVDPADLHKTIGSISFGIGVPAPASESGQQVDSSWLSIALRVITDGAEMLAVGAIVLAVLLVRRSRGDLGQVTRLAIVCGCIVAIGWIWLLAADAAAVGFGNVVWSSLLLSSDPGRRALVGVQLALGLWWSFRVLGRAESQAALSFIVRILAVIAAGFVVAGAYGGHAGIGGSFIVGVALRVVHLGSVCVWIGTVAATWWLARRDHDLRRLWPSVSLLAAIALAITGVSGLLMSGRLVVTVTALLGTSYGQRVVAKAVLLVVLAVLGGFSAHRVRRGDTPRRLPVELGVASVAIVVAALLASAAPARGEQFLPIPAVTPQINTSDLSDLTASASIEPARPGPNLVQIRVLETRRPTPGPIESVSMRVTGADGTSIAERDGAPVNGLLEWSDIAIPNPGAYRVEVIVVRPAVPVSPFVASWTVNGAPVTRAKTVLSTRSWAPLAAALAAMWLVIVAIVRWWTHRRATRPETDAPDREQLVFHDDDEDALFDCPRDSRETQAALS